jgi:predicted nucleic acid-binding protein
LGLLTEIGTGPVALDSAIFIYFIERDPRYLAIVKPIFAAIDGGRLESVTSSLALLETLVAPLRSGNDVVARQYERFLTRSRGLHVVPIDSALLRAAAALRAAHRLKTPDAIQVASALMGGCSAFITNDRRIPSLPGLRVLQLENYSEP